ncbi:hypothetical protein [Methanobrevibacter millerae]|nr:hypothetical protein [Methanobrevibacter millerae]
MQTKKALPTFHIRINMDGWQYNIDEKTLREALDLEITEIENNGVEIIAKFNDNTEIMTPLLFDSPSHPFCNCNSKHYFCKHYAALMFYVEKHPELLKSDDDIEDIISVASESNIKGFLKRELEVNPDLKKRFLDEFSKKSKIDETHYSKKLRKIFRQGEGYNFEDHGMYDLDSMESDLYEFLREDITNILKAGEYDFAFELLLKIGKILNDEIASTSDSWYDLSEEYIQTIDALSQTIHLSKSQVGELYSNTDVIHMCL